MKKYGKDYAGSSEETPAAEAAGDESKTEEATEEKPAEQ